MAATSWRDAINELSARTRHKVISLLPKEWGAKDCEILLLRGAISPQHSAQLYELCEPCVPAIAEAANTKKAVVIEASGYHTFQAVSSTHCQCKCAYEGTARHHVYQRVPPDSALARALE